MLGFYSKISKNKIHILQIKELGTVRFFIFFRGCFDSKNLNKVSKVGVAVWKIKIGTIFNIQTTHISIIIRKVDTISNWIVHLAYLSATILNKIASGGMFFLFFGTTVHYKFKLINIDIMLFYKYSFMYVLLFFYVDIDIFFYRS